MADLDQGIPAEAISRFTAAEARLYPMAMTDAIGYQEATMLVGLTVTELRKSCDDIATVLRRRSELIALLPEIAATARQNLGGLPADVVVDAASAVRCRELQAEVAAVKFKARLDAARAAGQEWLVDDADPAEVMAGSYRRVELHLPTGSSLITSIQAGGVGSSAMYSIEVVRHAQATMPSQRQVYPNREAWLDAADEFRAELSGDQ